MRKPARKVKKSAVKNIVRFPPIKSNNGKTILLESILESKYCLHLEYDPNVVSYFPQPKTFTFTDDDGVENTYTPDFEVQYLSGSRVYIEVKPDEYVSSVHYQHKFSSFTAFLQNTNQSFLVVDEFDIYQRPLLSNFEKLYQYRKRPTLDMRNLHKCASKMGISMPLATLIDRLGLQAQLREIYSWLALGFLDFDMRSEELSLETEVRFNV